MKKKASGVYCARLAARGFKQRAAVSYDPRDIMSPVVHEITVRIMLVLMIMALWHTEIIDVKGAFLKASFDTKHKVYTEIPKGFEKFYPKNALLLLKKTLYGVKNAAKAFWLVLLKIMASIGLLRSKADPCLYYTWDAVYGLIIILSWIDDLLIFGKCEGVLHYNKKITDLIDCDDIGPLTDYIGNKIEFNRNERWVRLTQSVFLRSVKDEFTFSEPNKCPKTPAVPGSVLRVGTSDEGISVTDQKNYCLGDGKLLFLMKWSWPDILNSVQDLSRFMSCARPSHVKWPWNASCNSVYVPKTKG